MVGEIERLLAIVALQGMLLGGGGWAVTGLDPAVRVAMVGLGSVLVVLAIFLYGSLSLYRLAGDA